MNVIRMRDRKGFMLAEAMISIVIIGICLSVIVESFYQSYKALVLNEQYSQALLLMNNTMGLLLHNDAIASPTEEEGQFEGAFAQFRYSIEQAPLSDEDETLQEVAVHVHWPSGSRERQMTFNTFLLKQEAE